MLRHHSFTHSFKPQTLIKINADKPLMGIKAFINVIQNANEKAIKLPTRSTNAKSETKIFSILPVCSYKNKMYNCSYTSRNF